MTSISITSQSSSSATFLLLFDAALQDYIDKSGTSLFDHPFAKQLETLESVSSITSVLQEKAQSLREFRENNGNLMNAFKSLVDVLCAISALDGGIGLVVRLKAFIKEACFFLIAILQPFPPVKAVFVGIGILLTVCLSSSDLICITP